MTRTIRGLTATLLLAALLTATPWLLLTVGRLPGFLPAWTDLPRLLTSPDTGRFLLVLVWGVAWALWGWIAIIILVEITAVVRRVKAPRLPASTGAQALVRALVIAAAAAFVTAPLATADTTPPTTTSAAPTQPGGSSTSATAEPDTAPVVEAEQRTVTVREGDTLWDLAGEYLGDPLRWPEIFELNRGVSQPSGYALEDPDQIDIGWTLTLPPDPATATTAPKRAAAAETSQDTTTAGTPRGDAAEAALDGAQEQAPAVRASAPTAAATAAPQTSAAPSSNVVAFPRAVDATTATADPAVVDEDESVGEVPVFGWQVAGLLGAGTFLGVGVAALLASRRREQHRIRRPGRVIVAPPAVVAPIEKTAHFATGLSAALVARLDAVLQRLDADLDLTAITVARDGTITLHTPDPVSEPWQKAEAGWILHHSIPVDEVGDLVPDRPCPYPLLVTIGADAADAVVLLNLEHIGHVTVAGDETMVEDFLRYIAAELAVNPWSEYVRAHCAGPAALVVGMAADRMDADLDEIRAIAQENLDRTSLADVNSSVGRAEQLGDEHWPTGAIIGDTTPADLTDLVQDHQLRAGIAVVTQAAGTQGALTVTGSGRVHGLGYNLTAVGLTEDEAAGCAALLAAADTDDDAPAPAADDTVDVTGNILPERTTEREDLDGELPILPFPDHEYLDTTAATEEDLAILAPRVIDTVAEELQERDLDLDAQIRAWFHPHCPYPRLSLLGPVTARVHGTPITKQKAYYTELLAYLALHPEGVTGEQIADAFGITVDRARKITSTLRQWVGTNPRTNTPHIPDARASEPAKVRGIGLYLVEDLLVDADLFRRLRTRGQARGPEGIEDLEAALQIVTGQPFTQLRSEGWTWLFEGDRMDQHMICAVGDVAHLLVTHHLHTDDRQGALRAASIGLLADPYNETLKLDLAAARAIEGSQQAVRRNVADALGDDADLDLTDRGVEVADRRGWLALG